MTLLCGICLSVGCLLRLRSSDRRLRVVRSSSATSDHRCGREDGPEQHRLIQKPSNGLSTTSFLHFSCTVLSPGPFTPSHNTLLVSLYRPLQIIIFISTSERCGLRLWAVSPLLLLRQPLTTTLLRRHVIDDQHYYHRHRCCCCDYRRRRRRHRHRM